MRFHHQGVVACPTDQIKDITVCMTFVYLGVKYSDISYSGSPSILTVSGGNWIWFRIGFRVVGLSIETWKEGWTAHMLSRSRRV